MRWYGPNAGLDITNKAPEQLRVLTRAERSLGGDALPFPKLIVMGPGNTGKSTVLNRFIQLKVLPCRDGVCTKRPIKVEMRDVPLDDPRFQRGGDAAEGGGGGGGGNAQEQKLLQFIVTIVDTKDRTTEVFPLSGATPESVDPKEAAAMLDYVEARGAPVGAWSKLKGFLTRGEAETSYVAEELVVKIESPGMMHFDLVDLPGLEWVEEQTVETIERYFNPATIEDTFVLVFRDASSGSGGSMV